MKGGCVTRGIFLLVIMSSILLFIPFVSAEDSIPAPTGLGASISFSGDLSLNWDPAPGSLSNGKVEIWRSYNYDGPWNLQEMMDLETVEYMEKEIVPITSYYYKLKYYDGEDVSLDSNIVSVIITYDNSVIIMTDHETWDYATTDISFEECADDSSDLCVRRLKLINQKSFCEIAELVDTPEGTDISNSPVCGKQGPGGSFGIPENAESENIIDLSVSELSVKTDLLTGVQVSVPSFTKLANDCDASFRSVYGDNADCGLSSIEDILKEKDELELMKVELENLKDLPSVTSDIDELIEKRDEHNRALENYLEKAVRSDAAWHKSMFNRGIMQEQYAMMFQAQGDGEKALNGFEAAREFCEEAANLALTNDEIFASRMCAARNALKHAFLLGPRDPMLQDAQREYRDIAQEIDLLEDSKERERLLSLAIEALAGLAHAEILEGKFSSANIAINEAELLDPDNPLTKHMRNQFELAFIDVIARHLEYSNSEAYNLLNRMLRTDESDAAVTFRSGPNKLLFYLTDIRDIAAETGEDQLRLTDEQIGMALISQALAKGKSLDEIFQMNFGELSELFGSDSGRTRYAIEKMEKAFDNVDLKEYIHDIDRGFVFETGQSYLDAEVHGRLDDSVKVDDTVWGFFKQSYGQVADEMFSMEGVAMNLLPFAQLSGKVGLLSNSGKMLIGKELWKASARAESMSSIGATWHGMKTVFPSLGKPGALIHGKFAATRLGNAYGGFAARNPNAMLAIGMFEGTAIGVGGTLLAEEYAPGSGIIFGTITGEFSPLARLAGSATRVARLKGISVTTGQSSLPNYGMTLTKTPGDGIYSPTFSPEAGKGHSHDTQIVFDVGTGERLGVSTRFVADKLANSIPIFEFVNAEAHARYSEGLQLQKTGMYKHPDGTQSILYVKGEPLPKILPDVEANSLLITGEKPKRWFDFGKQTRVERVMIEETASNSELLSVGLDGTKGRMFIDPKVQNGQTYVPRPGDETSIAGAVDNVLISKESQSAMIEVLSTRPMIIQGDSSTALGLDLSRKGPELVRAEKALVSKGNAQERFDALVALDAAGRTERFKGEVINEASVVRKDLIDSLAKDLSELSVKDRAILDELVTTEGLLPSLFKSSEAKEFLLERGVKIESEADSDSFQILPDPDALPGTWGHAANRLDEKIGGKIFFDEEKLAKVGARALASGDDIVIGSSHLADPFTSGSSITEFNSINHEFFHLWARSIDSNLNKNGLQSTLVSSILDNSAFDSGEAYKSFVSNEVFAQAISHSEAVRKLYFSSMPESPNRLKIRKLISENVGVFRRMESHVDNIGSISYRQAKVARDTINSFDRFGVDDPSTFNVWQEVYSDGKLKNLQITQQLPGDGSYKILFIPLGEKKMGVQITDSLGAGSKLESNSIQLIVGNAEFIHKFRKENLDSRSGGELLGNNGGSKKFIIDEQKFFESLRKDVLESPEIKGQLEKLVSMGDHLVSRANPMLDKLENLNIELDKNPGASVDQEIDIWMKHRDGIWDEYLKFKKATFDELREQIPEGMCGLQKSAASKACALNAVDAIPDSDVGPVTSRVGFEPTQVKPSENKLTLHHETRVEKVESIINNGFLAQEGRSTLSKNPLSGEKLGKDAIVLVMKVPENYVTAEGDVHGPCTLECRGLTKHADSVTNIPEGSEFDNIRDYFQDYNENKGQPIKRLSPDFIDKQATWEANLELHKFDSNQRESFDNVFDWENTIEGKTLFYSIFDDPVDAIPDSDVGPVTSRVADEEIMAARSVLNNLPNNGLAKVVLKDGTALPARSDDGTLTFTLDESGNVQKMGYGIIEGTSISVEETPVLNIGESWVLYPIQRISLEKDIKISYIFSEDGVKRGEPSRQNSEGAPKLDANGNVLIRNYQTLFYSGHGAGGGRIVDLPSHVQDGQFIHFGSPAKGNYVWVVDSQGEMMMGKRATDTQRLPKSARGTENKLAHSVLARGRDIYAAGEIAFEDGRVKLVDSQTGHYSPRSEGEVELSIFNQQVEEVYTLMLEQTGLQEIESGVTFGLSNPDP